MLKTKINQTIPLPGIVPLYIHAHSCFKLSFQLLVSGLKESIIVISFLSEPEEIFIKTLLKPESQKSQILSTRLYNQNKSYSAMYKVY